LTKISKRFPRHNYNTVKNFFNSIRGKAFRALVDGKRGDEKDVLRSTPGIKNQAAGHRAASGATGSGAVQDETQSSSSSSSDRSSMAGKRNAGNDINHAAHGAAKKKQKKAVSK
jgi:hypothetical protein